jgi:mono/diheme cytochrome c family protein
VLAPGRGLFLTEAEKSARRLPTGSSEVRAGINHVLELVLATSSPDTVTAAAKRVIDGLASRYQVALEDVPDQAPSLARGASTYQLQCARCHGGLGRNGRDAGGLDPLPATRLTRHSPTRIDYVGSRSASRARAGLQAVLSAEERWAVALRQHAPAPSGRFLSPDRVRDRPA